jgi:hypothetical protein
MSIAHKKAVGIASILVSFLIPFALLNSNFPFLGIAIVGIVLSALGLFFKAQPIRDDYIWAGSAILLSFLFVIRTNPLLLFFTSIGLLYSLSFLYSNITDKYRSYFAPIVPHLMLILPWVQKDTYSCYRDLMPSKLWYVNNKNKEAVKSIPKENKIGEQTASDQVLIRSAKTLFTLGVSFVLIITLIAILGSANPIFKSIGGNLLELIGSIGQLLASISIFDPLARFVGSVLWRSPLIIFLLFYVPKVLSSVSKPVKTLIEGDIPSEKLIKYSIPKILASLVLLVFIATQLQLYTASYEGLVELGLTASERVNEVFGQLIWAMLLVLGLLYFDVARFRFGKIVSYILVTLVLIITGFALYSNIYYIQGFGLSPARLYGLAAVFWLVVMSAIILFKNRANASHQLVLKLGIMTTVAAVALVGVINFDAQIYNYNKATFSTRNSYDAIPVLSADSGNLGDVIELSRSYKKDHDNLTNTNQQNYTIVNNLSLHEGYQDNLKQKYCNKVVFWSFNFNELRATWGKC